jgi:hypothetical protein
VAPVLQAWTQGIIWALGPQICHSSYLGDVSRVREARALEKNRVSQSFTSRSRICGEGRREVQKGLLLSPIPGHLEPSAWGFRLATGTCPRAAGELCQEGRVWVFMSCPFKIL